jgi:hypothetical protein
VLGIPGRAAELFAAGAPLAAAIPRARLANRTTATLCVKKRYVIVGDASLCRSISQEPQSGSPLDGCRTVIGTTPSDLK